jgi:hypothetical protein
LTARAKSESGSPKDFSKRIRQFFTSDLSLDDPGDESAKEDQNE